MSSVNNILLPASGLLNYIKNINLFGIIYLGKICIANSVALYVSNTLCLSYMFLGEVCQERHENLFTVVP